MNTKNKQSEFMEWYAPLHEGFVRFCSSRSYGIMETEDLVQEATLAAFERFDSIRDRKAMLGYLMRVASNIVTDKLRRKKFKGYYDEEAFARLKAAAPSPEIATDVHYLYQAMRKLPKAGREAIELFEVAGFSIKEIAEIQQSSESAVKVRLHRARTALREELAPVTTLESAVMAVGLLLTVSSL